MKVLISLGADINAANQEDGRTSLIYAAHEGELEAVKVLVEHRADVNAVDNEGKTALNWAEEENQSDIAAFLQELEHIFIIE